MQISFLLPARQFIQPLSLPLSLSAAANVIEIKCFILRGRPKTTAAATTTTTTITYSKLASSISSTVQCVFVDVAKGRDSRNLLRRNMHFRARWPRPTDRPTWGSFAQMDGYKRRSQERSQSVGAAVEEERKEGRCRKDHFDGHLETIQLCCGLTD